MIISINSAICEGIISGLEVPLNIVLLPSTWPTSIWQIPPLSLRISPYIVLVTLPSLFLSWQHFGIATARNFLARISPAYNSLYELSS